MKSRKASVERNFVTAARTAIEFLEPRLLFAASATVIGQASAVEGTQQFDFTVEYTGVNDPVNTATLGNQNVVVTGPGGFTQAGTFVSQIPINGLTLDATYSLTATGNVLSTAAAGTYTVTVEPFNATAGTGVADIRGNPIPAGPAGTFSLQVQPAPVLELSSPVFTAAQYSSGSSIPFHATVTNDGHATAAPFTLGVALVPTLLTTNVSVDVLATATVNQSLAPGQSLIVNVPDATIPAATPAGNYDFKAQINLNVEGAAHNSNDVFTSAAPVVVTTPAPTPTPVTIGGLDPHFGVGGVVLQTTPLVTTNAVAAQTDGKTIAVGETNAGNGTHDFGVTRFNADGSLDTAFGQTTSGGVTTPGSGTVTTDFGGNDDMPIAVAIQPDGRIIVLGTSFAAGNPSQSSFALARYNTDGSLDASFGGSGMVVTSFTAAGAATPSSDIAESMILLSNGQIVVCGRSNAAGTFDFALARYNTDGSLDAGFGGTGKVLTDFFGGNDSAYDVDFNPRTGDIIAVGAAGNPGTGQIDFALAGYKSDGALDPKFGTAGKTVTAINGLDDEAYGMAISPQGLIIATGATSVSSGGTVTSEPATVEYTATGKLNRHFGTGGMVATDLGQPGVADQVQLNPGGGVLIAGGTTPVLSSVDPTHIEVDVVQYNAKGKIDPTFAGGHPLILNLGGTSPALGRAFAPDASSQSQQAMQALAQQHAIAQQLGNLVVVANTGSQTGIAMIVAQGASLLDSLQTTFAPLVPDAAKGTASVTVKNMGDLPATGTVTITLYASFDTSLDSGDTQLAILPNAGLKLKASGVKVFKLKVSLPSTLADGTYHLLAKIDPGPSVSNVNAANDVAGSAATIQVENPFSGLNGPSISPPTGLQPGSTFKLLVTIDNTSGLLAKGTVGIQALAAANVAPAPSDATLAATSLKLKLPPGASHVFPIKLVLPATLSAGTYYLLVILTPPPTANGSAGTDILAGSMPLVIG